MYRQYCMLMVIPVAVGCYTYTPLDTSVGITPGEHVAVEINDRGRAELSDRIGTGVMRLEGYVTRTDSADMTMNVWRVAQIGGATSRWSGESVRFRREFVAGVHQRSLNRPRTWLVVGLVGAGLYYLASSTSLFGDFIGGLDPPPDPPPTSSRGWWY